jgi:hypothetical protein
MVEENLSSDEIPLKKTTSLEWNWNCLYMWLFGC